MLEDPGESGLEKGSKVSPEGELELDVEREAGVYLTSKGENQANLKLLWDPE